MPGGEGGSVDSGPDPGYPGECERLRSHCEEREIARACCIVAAKLVFLFVFCCMCFCCCVVWFAVCVFGFVWFGLVCCFFVSVVWGLVAGGSAGLWVACLLAGLLARVARVALLRLLGLPGLLGLLWLLWLLGCFARVARVARVARAAWLVGWLVGASASDC